MAIMIKLQTKPSIVIILILIQTLFTFPNVEAEAKTIVVPDDYSTIQEAISKATDGDKVFVKKGIYLIDENTTIVISKTLSLIGEDPSNTTIIGASSAIRENCIAIRLAAPNITVSGFTFSNFRVAIAIVNYYEEPYPSGCKIVKNNIINNSEGIRPQRNDLLVSENNITKNNVGISGYNTENVFIARNSISKNGYGINIGICKNLTVSENQIFDNSKGGLNLYYFGPHFVYNNTIANNSWGIRFAEGCGNATVYGNNITQNGIGVVLLIFPNAGDVVVSGVGNTVFSNLFINNTVQVSQEESTFNYPDSTRMGTDIVSWDDGTIGNYWNDYNGTDSNGDGIGDIPYVIDANNQDNYPIMMLYGTAITPSPEPTSTPEFESEPFAMIIILVSITVVTFVGLSLLVYFKKRKH